MLSTGYSSYMYRFKIHNKLMLKISKQAKIIYFYCVFNEF